MREESKLLVPDEVTSESTCDIEELFARDPLLLVRNDITEIVKTFRNSRHLLNTTGKAAPAKKTAKQKELAEAVGDTTLEDLGL